MNLMPQSDSRWLLLIHQIPPKPDYLRVKIWRRLQRLGAVPVKNSVYVLPKSEQTQEDFQWVLREIVESGGDASLCEARFVDGLTDNEVEELFRSTREPEYRAIFQEAERLAGSLSKRSATTVVSRKPAAVELERLQKRLAEVIAVDFFDAPGREAAAGVIAGIEARLRGGKAGTAYSAPKTARREGLLGKTWVTRKGIHVDRMASAWLVRRFIDPKARFKFVPAKGYKPLENEIRFDMFEAEFTHVGDRCTMEVLLESTGIDDAALRLIAEIVHDIDLKDSKFAHNETAGIDLLIAGIAMSRKDDDGRLDRAAALFEDLYEYYRRKRG